MSGRGRFNTRSSAQNYNPKMTYNTRNASYNSPYSSPSGGYQPQKEPPQPAAPHNQPPPSTPQRQQAQAPAPSPAQTPTQYQQQPPPLQEQPPQQQPPVQQKVEIPPPPVPQNPAAVAEPKPENAALGEEAKTMEAETGGEEGKKKFRKWSRRTPDFKVPRRIRKRRQNARLKNLLAPKNAMMVLHELHPELKMSILEQPNAHNQITHTVEIELDGKVFQGVGMSKMAAKQAGSEAALKAILLKKLEENNVRLTQQAANKMETGFDEDVSMADASVTEGSVKGDSEEGQNGGTPKLGKHTIPEDDVPWGSLASFALYKLFSEWQSQGYQVPAASGLQYVAPTSKPVVVAPPAPTPMKKIPDDANQKHPVQLLNQLRPGSQFVEQREGMPPNLTFTYTVKVDDLVFQGLGNSKKEAKKQCAKHALEHLGVVYND